MTGSGWPMLPGDEPGGAPDPADWMRRQLFERRIVVLAGTLDDRCATGTAAALMTLDASGDAPVELQIDSGEGTLDAGLALMDVIDLLGVPVHAWCTGRAGGPAVGVLAVCHRRTASPHARIQLSEPQVTFAGDARHLEQRAADHLTRWASFCERLSEATGRPLDSVADDAAHGRYLSAEEAVGYGLLDDVSTPDAADRPHAGSTLRLPPGLIDAGRPRPGSDGRTVEPRQVRPSPSAE